MQALALVVLLVAQGPPAGTDAAAAIVRGDAAHAAFDLEGARSEDARARAAEARRQGDEAGAERAEAEARALFEQALTYRELSSLGGFVRGVARAALGGMPKGTLEDSEWLLRAAAAELERALALPDREPRDRLNRADAEARLRRLAK